VLCGQVCRWLRCRGHALLVLTTGSPAASSAAQAPAVVDGVPARRALRSY
jgi:hypothetical protein